MAWIEKLKGVGQAVSAKVKETLGDATADAPPHAPADDAWVFGLDGGAPSAAALPPLDAAAARAILGLTPHAALSDVRRAAQLRARVLLPRAQRDGPESAAARALERELEALEVLEEALLPLEGPALPHDHRTAAPRPRATPRTP